MKVLLTGAMGFLGYRTLEKLIENPQVSEVVAAARTVREWRRITHPKVTYAFGDLTDARYAEAVVKGCGAIIHTAALSSPWGPVEEFRKANVVVQQHLIHAAKAEGVGRFIYVSTPSMYFELKDKWDVTEADPLPRKFINAYAQTKREAEIALEQSGIPYIAIRPRALIGRGDTIIMPRLIRAYEEGRLKVIGSGKNRVDLTPVANVADVLNLALTAQGAALNQIYNITNGEPVLLWDKIRLVLEKLGKELADRKMPFGLVKTVARLLELKARLTDGKEPALTVYGVGTLAYSFTMDITKARDLLGYAPAMTTDEAIDEFITWYSTR